MSRILRLTAIDIIPMPDAELSGYSTAFDTAADQAEAQRQLDHLNWQLTQNADRNGLAAQAEETLRSLLDPEQLTDLYV